MSVDHGAFGTLCYPSRVLYKSTIFLDTFPPTPIFAPNLPTPAPLLTKTHPRHHETLNISGPEILPRI